jgi:hypothetical protein
VLGSESSTRTELSSPSVSQRTRTGIDSLRSCTDDPGWSQGIILATSWPSLRHAS